MESREAEHPLLYDVTAKCYLPMRLPEIVKEKIGKMVRRK